MHLNQYIDHTLLKPIATKSQIKEIMDEAIKFSFKSICVNPAWVKYCALYLKDYPVMVCTVVGFPLGANDTEIKCAETKKAVEDGADEIDMVINIGALKDKNYNLVENDIRQVVKAASGKTVKVIIETCFLTDEEKVKVCELIINAKAHFVKTSTGFGSGGATLKDVALLKKTVNEKLLIKASGGISNSSDALEMIKAGANRLGTSKGVEILK